MASVSAWSSPSREVKCPNSSPTDNVAEVNTQAARVAAGHLREPPGHVEGQEAQREPARGEFHAARAVVVLGMQHGVETAREFAGAGGALRDADTIALLRQLGRQRAQRRDEIGGWHPRTVCRPPSSWDARCAAVLPPGRPAPFPRRPPPWRAATPGRELREFQTGIANGQLHLPAAHTRAEELRGEVGDLVRLVEDHRVRGAKQIAETVFLEREVGQQQVMIDDDHVGLHRATAGIEHVTAADVRATRAQAVVTRGGDLRPQRMRIAEIRHLGEVPGLRDHRPAVDARHHAVARVRASSSDRRAA